MRNPRRYALGAIVLALAVLGAACSSGGGASSAGGGGPLAGSLTLGAPPECPKAPFCIPGLKKTYGITFQKFVPLQAGPATVAALKGGKVDVAELFSTDPSIAQNNFVV